MSIAREGNREKAIISTSDMPMIVRHEREGDRKDRRSA
jgi:hypothetical protein